VLAAGCTLGIRYDERLEQDMIAVPIGPRVQHSPPAQPGLSRTPWAPSTRVDLLGHACVRALCPSGAMIPWGIGARRRGGAHRSGRALIVAGRRGDRSGRRCGGRRHRHHRPLRGLAAPLLVSGALDPCLNRVAELPGPFLYYPGRRLVPAPLRASSIIYYIKVADPDRAHRRRGWGDCRALNAKRPP